MMEQDPFSILEELTKLSELGDCRYSIDFDPSFRKDLRWMATVSRFENGKLHQYDGKGVTAASATEKAFNAMKAAK